MEQHVAQLLADIGVVIIDKGIAELIYLFYAGAATAKDITLSFRANMPAFMVPRKLMALEEMPHLPNGKIAMSELKEMMKK